MPIYKLDDLEKAVKRENLQVAIVSFGGSGSNGLAEFYQSKGINTRARCWQNLLCHCPEPIKMDIPVIYVYNEDARDAFCSQRRRRRNLAGPGSKENWKGIWKDNQKKLSNGSVSNFSDETLLSLMIQQFKNWAKVADQENVLFITFQELFTDAGKDKLNSHIKRDFKDYPKWGDREKHVYKFDDDKELFGKFKDDLEFIKNFRSKNTK